MTLAVAGGVVEWRGSGLRCGGGRCGRPMSRFLDLGRFAQNKCRQLRRFLALCYLFSLGDQRKPPPYV